MQKRTIYLIIGLITAAVVGVIWLQLDLIRTGLKVNEQRYDQSVQTALKKVADDQRRQEEIQVDVTRNGFTSSGRNFGNLGGVKGSALREAGSGLLRIEGEYFSSGKGNPISILRSEWESSHFRMWEYYQNLPLDKRINLESLTGSLRTELSNQGIRGNVEYGVYDARRHRFIIHDGRYLSKAAGDTSLFSRLHHSAYKVSLFDNGGEAAGYLMAFFAERDTAIWSELWLNFAASLLFALIILGCFVYTIYVIQRQKQVSEMKTDFINNMTHEFKTPIATISLATDSIVSPKISGNPDKVARFANIIKQENKRMNKQVEKVLQMAKLDKQQVKLKVTEVNLHDIIQLAVEYISLQVDPRGGQVTTRLEATTATVEGDQTHLSNLVNNLLDNANKYSPDAPVIEVSTRNLAEGVEMTVSDQGLGMSKEARKHIFDRFYRVHTGDRHDVKGFGLGLSYVKTIVDAHGGNIKVKSELGKGSSFILFFPFRQG